MKLRPRGPSQLLHFNSCQCKFDIWHHDIFLSYALFEKILRSRWEKTLNLIRPKSNPNWRSFTLKIKTKHHNMFRMCWWHHQTNTVVYSHGGHTILQGYTSDIFAVHPRPCFKLNSKNNFWWEYRVPHYWEIKTTNWVARCVHLLINTRDSFPPMDPSICTNSSDNHAVTTLALAPEIHILESGSKVYSQGSH